MPANPYQILKTLSLFILISLLTACASQQTPPTDTPSMAEVYQQALANNHQDSLDHARQQVSGISKASSEGKAQTNALQLTPNPEITMTVMPHWAGKAGIVVPTYQIQFTLYEYQG